MLNYLSLGLGLGLGWSILRACVWAQVEDGPGGCAERTLVEEGLGCAEGGLWAGEEWHCDGCATLRPLLGRLQRVVWGRTSLMSPCRIALP